MTLQSIKTKKGTDQHIEIAKNELRVANAQRFKGKERRVTKQMRMSIETHRKLRTEALKRSMTASKLLDEICAQYFRYL